MLLFKVCYKNTFVYSEVPLIRDHHDVQQNVIFISSLS